MDATKRPMVKDNNTLLLMGPIMVSSSHTAAISTALRRILFTALTAGDLPLCILAHRQHHPSLLSFPHFPHPSVQTRGICGRLYDSLPQMHSQQDSTNKTTREFVTNRYYLKYTAESLRMCWNGAQPHDILKRLLHSKDIGINPQRDSVEEWLEKME